jgi:hypothetical protein
MRKLARLLIVILAAVLAAAVYFRASVASGFDVLPCDKWDGSLIFGIVDHWRLAFSGARDWRSLQMFWPASGAIGYSDTFFLHGALYSALCDLGMDHYRAFTAVFMAMATAGFAGMHLLLRRWFKLPFVLALVVSFLFVNLAPLGAAGTHLQIVTVWLLPWLVLCGLETISEGRRVRRCLFAAGTGILFAALFLTTFYVPWFFAFALCVAAAVWFARQIGTDAGGFVRALRSALAGRGFPVAFFLAAFMVALVPFFAAYLPALLSGGSWSYKGLARSLPGLVDFVNVGGANYVWGRLFGPWLDARDYAYELHFGLPPVTLAVFILALVLFLRERAQGRLTGEGRAALYCGAVVVVSWILLLRIGGVSLWSVVHALVPGAGAIRAVFRFNAVLSFFALIVVAVFLKELWEKRGLLVRGAAIALLLAMIVEQFSAIDTASLLRRSEDLRFMESVPSPPSDARAFYAESAAMDSVKTQITAFRVAQRYGLETVNGFSGSAPGGFLARDTHSSDYARNVAGWLDFEPPGGFYALDLDARVWRRADFPVPKPYIPGADIVRSGFFDNFNAGGWSEVETTGVWSDGRFAKLVLFAGKDFKGPKCLEMECSAFLPKDTPFQRATVRVNGRSLGEVEFRKAGETRRYSFVLPEDCNNAGKLVFSFDIPKARSPLSRGLSNDGRRLGIQLKSFIVKPALQNP